MTALAAAVLAAAFAGGVPLVEEGDARAVLVVPEKAPPAVRSAAQDMSFWVEKLTGARLASVPRAAEGMTPVVFSMNAPEVTGDGFRLTASREKIEIAAGRDARSLRYAVFYLLNRYGGIYWCHPDSGADFTPRRSFSLPEGMTLRNPMPIRVGHITGDGRSFSPAARRAVADWNLRNGFPEEDGRIHGGGHFPGRLLLKTPVDADELARECEAVKAEAADIFVGGNGDVTSYARWRILVRRHPGWFGLVGGRRVPCGVDLRKAGQINGDSSMPCLSNPEVRRQLLANFREWRSAMPSGKPVEWRMLCDDQGQWCECDRCMRLLRGRGIDWNPGRGGDYWWDFVNWFAERALEDPTVTIVAYAYNIYRDPPTRIRPIVHPRVYMIVCPQFRCYFHPLTDPACETNGRFLDVFRRWQALGLPCATFEYANQTPGACNYLFWERSWVQDLKWYRANGIVHAGGGLLGPWTGYSFQPCYFRENAARARWAQAWLTGYFEWDPDADFETVRNGLFDAYYRAANVPMKAYRALLEKAVPGSGRCMRYGCQGDVIRVAATEDLVARAEALLDEAESAARGDPVLLARLADERGWFETNWKATGVPQDAPAVHRIAIAGERGKRFATAAPMTDFRRLVHGDVPMKGTVAYGAPTAVRLVHDRTHLLADIECRPGAIAVNDAVRVLVVPPGYAQPGFSATIGSDGKRSAEWLPVLHGGTVDRPLPDVRMDMWKNGDGSWCARLSLPLAPFGGYRPGMKWKLDVTRFSNGQIVHSHSGSLSGMMHPEPEYLEIFEFQ